MDEQQNAGLIPHPAAVPVEPAADVATPGAANTGTTAATGTTETSEETAAQRAEREKERERKREDRRERKLNERFGELTGQIKHYQTLIDRMVGQPNAQSAGASSPDRAPQRDDRNPDGSQKYESYEDYIEARSDWRADQKVRAFREELTQGQQHAVAMMQRAQVEQSHIGRVEAFARSNPDFAEVIDAAGDVMVPSAAAEAIKEMDDGPAIIATIGKYPQIAARLHQLPPMAQIVLLGKISAALQQRPSQASKAPEPGKPVGGKAAPAASDPGRMSDKEFAEWRRRQIAARR